MTKQDLLALFKKEYPTRKDHIIRVETRDENSIFVTVDVGFLIKYIFTYKDETNYSLELA